MTLNTSLMIHVEHFPHAATVRVILSYKGNSKIADKELRSIVLSPRRLFLARSLQNFASTPQVYRPLLTLPREWYLPVSEASIADYVALCDMDPVSIDLERVQFSRTSDNKALILSLPMAKQPPVTTMETQPWSAEKIKLVTGMHCQQCQQTVILPLKATTNPALFPSARALPAAYWHELADCWLCHNNDAHAAFSDPLHMKKLQRPREEAEAVVSWRSIAVRSSRCIWQQDNQVCLQKVPASEEMDQEWTFLSTAPYQVQCAACQSVLGHCSESDNEEVIIFNKFALSLSFQYGPWMQPCPILSLIAYELLETMDAHDCYRFVIEAKQADEFIVLQLQILNGNTRASSGQLSEWPDAVNKSQAAVNNSAVGVKVLYKNATLLDNETFYWPFDVDHPNHHDESDHEHDDASCHSDHEQAAATTAVERITWPFSVVQQLQQILDHHSETLFYQTNEQQLHQFTWSLIPIDA